MQAMSSSVSSIHPTKDGMMGRTDAGIAGLYSKRWKKLESRGFDTEAARIHCLQSHVEDLGACLNNLVAESCITCQTTSFS